MAYEDGSSEAGVRIVAKVECLRVVNVEFRFNVGFRLVGLAAPATPTVGVLALTLTLNRTGTPFTCTMSGWTQPLIMYVANPHAYNGTVPPMGVFTSDRPVAKEHAKQIPGSPNKSQDDEETYVYLLSESQRHHILFPHCLFGVSVYSVRWSDFLAALPVPVPSGGAPLSRDTGVPMVHRDLGATAGNSTLLALRTMRERIPSTGKDLLGCPPLLCET
eukprot:gene10906-1981_t